MAVFVASCDESAGKTKRDEFYFGGFIGPEEDWSRFFAPAWQERVLDGPPSIPYLHMTDIRSPQWREGYGISRLQADDRVDEAIRLLETMHTLYALQITVDGGRIRDAFDTIKITAPKKSPKPFEPDYLCFLTYALAVLHYVHDVHPQTEKVDFIIETNGQITKHIQEFHLTIADNLKRIGNPELSDLVGELIPGGKERVPLQAADVLCWYTARTKYPELMDDADIGRLEKLGHKKGKIFPISDDIVMKLAKILIDSSEGV